MFGNIEKNPNIQGEVLRFGRCLCGSCGKKGKMGTTVPPNAQNPKAKILCVDCTINDLAKRRGFSFKEAKEKFEKSQKSQEILVKAILQKHEQETGKKIPKSMQELAELMQPGLGWWQHSLTELQREKISEMSKDEQKEHFLKSPILATPNVPYVNENQTGRNDPCPCGSGKKYKKCCLDKQ